MDTRFIKRRGTLRSVPTDELRRNLAASNAVFVYLLEFAKLSTAERQRIYAQYVMNKRHVESAAQTSIQFGETG